MKLMVLSVLAGAVVFGQGDASWTSYGKNSLGWRYSELDQINTQTVSKLEWVFSKLSAISGLPGARKASSGPHPPVAKLCVVRTKSKPFFAARQCISLPSTM